MQINNWNKSMKEFLSDFGIDNPKTLSIYREALTHKTYANENNLDYNYERLELLGDSAINWVVTNFLYKRNSNYTEGEISLFRSNLVRKEVLAEICCDIELDRLILLGNGAKNNTSNISIYEDVFESFIGAVAQDQGIKKVIKILEKTIIKKYGNFIDDIVKDYKTQLQEMLQSRSMGTPKYIKVTNNNSKLKISKVIFDDCTYGEGEGINFKEAEQNAAKSALDKIS